jgi:hypothetical protein
MIDSVELIPVLKNGNLVDENTKLALWLPQRKAIKVNPDFSVKEYFFKVKTTKEYSKIKISINKFEEFYLTLCSEDSLLYEYKTSSLSSKYFLGFNLGLFELCLHLDFEEHPLATLNNKQGLLLGEQLEYMYESVANSDFFNLYISNYYRGNTLAKELEDNSIQHFWLCLALSRELLKEVDKFFNGQLDFTNRVHKESVIGKYHRYSVIDEEDIEWLMEHPNELSMSPIGDVYLSGLQYDIDQMSQSIMIADYDTYENRLLISCLYSIQSVLSELCLEYNGVKLFPHRSVNNIIDETSKITSQIIAKLNLSPPFNTFPEFSNKYLDDIRYVSLFGLISRWYAINNLSYGNELRSPILGITTIFEHFCFVKIIDCACNNGFYFNDIQLKDSDTSGLVKLTRNEETISVYYEPSILRTPTFPLKTSKVAETPYRPDIVIIYQGQGIMKCGVIDAKFSNADFIKRTLGPDIYYKYGLFLHKLDNQPLDYVFAIYPDVKGGCNVDYARNSDFINVVKPSLGYFSIPFHENSANEISKFLMSIITEC